MTNAVKCDATEFSIEKIYCSLIQSTDKDKAVRGNLIWFADSFQLSNGLKA